jgi:conjugal transfer pilus assembly protein TraB
MVKKFLYQLKQRGQIPSPDFLKQRKHILWAVVGTVAALTAYFLLSDSSSVPRVKKPPLKKITLASESLDDKEVWANRLERQTREARDEVEVVKEQNKLLLKKLEILEGAVVLQAQVSQEKQAEEIHVEKSASGQTFPGLPAAQKSVDYGPIMQAQSYRPSSFNGSAEPLDMGPRILHISLPESPTRSPKTVDGYIPAGTYVRAVLTSGVVASTAVGAQGDPQPIMLRMMDRGNLPRGFKGDLKDAVMIGACYGDISSERALCRLHKMSLTERNGEILERQIEGWIIGEDGRPGIKGVVVDRSGDKMREALLAGMLGGVSNFFKQQAESSVFPVSPFGQTNALKGGNLVAAGVANGAGSAFDKLAEFSIKRMEQMSPVIVVSSGRMLDVVFKTGVDISDTTVKQELQLMGQSTREAHAKQEAFSTDFQTQ